MHSIKDLYLEWKAVLYYQMMVILIQRKEETERSHESQSSQYISETWIDFFYLDHSDS